MKKADIPSNNILKEYLRYFVNTKIKLKGRKVTIISGPNLLSAGENMPLAGKYAALRKRTTKKSVAGRKVINKNGINFFMLPF